MNAWTLEHYDDCITVHIENLINQTNLALVALSLLNLPPFDFKPFVMQLINPFFENLYIKLIFQANRSLASFFKSKVQIFLMTYRFFDFYNIFLDILNIFLCFTRFFWFVTDFLWFHARSSARFGSLGSWFYLDLIDFHKRHYMMKLVGFDEY